LYETVSELSVPHAPSVTHSEEGTWCTIW
jgi:hypothetical protein